MHQASKKIVQLQAFGKIKTYINKFEGLAVSVNSQTDSGITMICYGTHVHIPGLMAPQIRILTQYANEIHGVLFTLQELLNANKSLLLLLAKPKYLDILKILDGKIPDIRLINIQDPNPPHGGMAVIIRSLSSTW